MRWKEFVELREESGGGTEREREEEEKNKESEGLKMKVEKKMTREALGR